VESKKYLEKRKYIRFDVKTKVNIKVKDRGVGDNLQGKIAAMSKNMSVSGICFFSPVQLVRGVVLDMEVFLPFELHPLCLKGEVRWCTLTKTESEGKKMYDVGVKLFTLDKNDESKFIKYNCDQMMLKIEKFT